MDFRSHLLFALAVVSASISIGEQAVFINEVMYHPASERDEEEYIELFNPGDVPVSLQAWRFTAGIRYTFPSRILAPGGYIVVAAHVSAFKKLHPDVQDVVGGWEGILSNSGEQIELQNDRGQRVDSFRYADDGDWAIRQKGPPDFGRRGWDWVAEHDGGGKSLELINPTLPNQYGQNWDASHAVGGTPGRRNSIRQTNVAPLILEARHSPAVPRSIEPILFTARAVDERTGGIAMTLHYRTQSNAPFSALPMMDDGRHNDDRPGDQIFAATLGPQANQTVVEFYFEATDGEGNRRYWPAPAWVDGVAGQSANLLLQVDDASDVGTLPLYRLIMSEPERAELAAIGRSWVDASSRAQMNGTFISTDGTGTQIRYNVGIRNRGNGSRAANPNNYRVTFRHDEPWKGVAAVNLNSQFTFAQLAGSALFQRAGLPAALARPVHVRVNGANLAVLGYPMYGFYVANEVMNSEFAERQFPIDSSGNIYRGIRLGLYSADPGTRATNFSANLSFLGESPEPYRVNYFKQTNTSQDDWRDLIGLTRTLAASASDPGYAAAVRQVAHVDQWLRFLALNTLIDNNETSVSNGDGDDYFLYAGRTDPRFVLLPYDLDTVLGQGSTPGRVTAGIFRAATIPVLDRFLRHPEFAPEYYRQLDDLMTSVMAPEPLQAFLRHVLGSLVPREAIDGLVAFATQRNAFVQGLIPRQLSVETDLEMKNGLLHAAGPSVAVRGRANVITTRTVKVNSVEAIWSAWEGKWTAPAVPVRIGMNRILVQALAADGRELDRQVIDVWRAGESTASITGAISADTQWESGPYSISGDVIIPEPVTLTIGPGATLYFSSYARLVIRGRLIARGTEFERIRFTRLPGTADTWRGLQFVDSARENVLSYCDMEFASAGAESIRVENSRLAIDHMTWSGTTKTILELLNASLSVRDSVFPNVHENETIHGSGIRPDGELVIERNIFGTTTGYSDVIDLSGAKRPGPIVQVLNNTFLGGSDDGVDLDAADGHLEGNLFQNFRKNNLSDSTSNAVATDLGSEIVLVRNVFFDNDHAVLLKGGASLIAQNNTIVGCRFSALNFGEPERGTLPGRRAELENNIFWRNPRDFENEQLGNPAPELRVANCLLSDSGTDPRFLDPAGDFRLGAGSPASGAGKLGIDLGAHVPPGAFISGEPPQRTFRTRATLNVSGPGITHYKFKVNDGSFSEALPVTEPIQLAGLIPGPYTVFVLGRNPAGVWQSESSASPSRAWTVMTSPTPVVLNEVLAVNVSTIAVGNRFPGALEIQNESSDPIDISGVGISDDSRIPYQFTFPAGTIIPPEGYLVILDGSSEFGRQLGLGFVLRASGQTLQLTDAPIRGGDVLDTVRFGLQIPDHSIGRLRDGNWGLTRPSLGTGNVPVRLGDQRRLQINEWLAATPRDEDDFVELLNLDVLPVSLGGLVLTDNSFSKFERTVFPSLSFAPANGTVLFSEGRSNAAPLGFGLAGDQGIVGLYEPNGTEIDFIYYGPQRSGVSQGRPLEDRSVIRDFVQPTPNRKNSLGVLPSDLDADGLPDQWEQANGLNPSAQDALLDADGDGLTNAAEYWSGTDPRDSKSAIRLRVEYERNRVGLRFQAGANRTYAVQESTDLTVWRSLHANFAAERDGPIEVDVPTPQSGLQFYRVLVLPFDPGE